MTGTTEITELADPAGVPPGRRWARRTRQAVFWLLVLAATAILVASLARIVLATHGFTDASPTMENTIQPGDVLRVADGQAGIRRGDVVVVNVPARTGSPGHPGTSGGTEVKRVIGLPGDHVTCCGSGGRVSVNSRPLNETYLYPGTRPSAVSFSVTVPSGTIFVLGDRRRISADSREWGPVPESGIVGRVVAVQRGSSLSFLRTPQAFVSARLAAPDTRPQQYLRLAAAAAAALAALVILAITGIVSTLVRGYRSRRARSSPVPPAEPAPPAAT